MHCEKKISKMDMQSKQGSFRDYIPPQDIQRSRELAASDCYEWSALRCADPFMIGWKQSWEQLYTQPYKGITVDGNIIPGLYHLVNANQDLTGPTAAMTKAAEKLLEIASPEEKAALSRPIDAPEWRRWLNPEIYIYKSGIRLEEVSEELVDAVHDIMKKSLSPSGYAKASGCMKVNRFLGEVVNGKKVLNEKSYNFSIFGTPSEDEPWGWQISGHHFCMNCCVVGQQIVISPVFMGAEPNVIDDGPDKGTELFTDQERLAIKLMQSMDPATIQSVRRYQELNDPAFPPWRFHRADQRHLGGAFQDNRVIPYEGVKVSTLPLPLQDMISQLAVLCLDYLPEQPLKARMSEISAHWTETYFCWIGGFQEQDAFYFKIHSPVVMAEFDHHSGVFLNNKAPLPFHIHTLVRTPNGNDYGKALLKDYYESLDHSKD